MDSTEQHTSKEKPIQIFAEKDVLGLEKTPTNNNQTKAHPNRIFIVLGCIAVLAVIYWLYKL